VKKRRYVELSQAETTVSVPLNVGTTATCVTNSSTSTQPSRHRASRRAPAASGSGSWRGRRRRRVDCVRRRWSLEWRETQRTWRLIYRDVTARSSLTWSRRKLSNRYITYTPFVIHKNSLSQQNHPRGFLTFFSKRLGISGSNFTRLLHVPIYARLQTFVNSPSILTKLCHIKRDHPVRILCSKCSPSADTHTKWPHLMWRNFITVGDNWIKICSLA